MNTTVIICNDPRIALVKDALQPVLITKLGIVSDFDAGLKEVFDKRPPLVFIQDEIAGVKAETVIRHIKSLLQANSPQFIHLYLTASDTDIFRDVTDSIDLNLTDNDLVAKFRDHLQQVPAIQWKEQSLLPPDALPEQPQHDGQAVADVFAFDEQPPQEIRTPAPETSPDEDDVFSFFTPQEDDAPQPVAQEVVHDDSDMPILALPPKGETVAPLPEIDDDQREPVSETSPRKDVAMASFDQDDQGDIPKLVKLESPEVQPEQDIPLAAERFEPASEPDDALSTEAVRQTPGRPRFQTSMDNDTDSLELPLPVESVTSPRRSRWLIGIALAIIIGGVAFYLFSRNTAKPPSTPVPPKQTLPAAPAKQEAPVAMPGEPAKPDKPVTASGVPAKPPAPPSAAPAAPPQKSPPVVAPAAPPQKSPPVTAPAAPPKPAPGGVSSRKGLPSFIPKEGIDTSYGATRPGWERYVSPRREYLVFRENGAIRALQVIALQQNAIDAPFISSLLRELCGETTIDIKTRASRDGYLIEQGQTANKAEVLFYKKKGTGETRGVVISLP